MVKPGPHQPGFSPIEQLKRFGRVNFNGHIETWYSQRVLPGKDLKIPGRHVGKYGLVMDKDKNICVATTLVGMNRSIQTSIGKGKRYDTCPTPNIVDIYTDW